MLDAYTVKKVLPRILIAAILINLSYYLVAIAIDVSNIIGLAIGDLLTKSFGMGSIGKAHFQSAQLTGGDTAGVITVTGGVVVVGIIAALPTIFGAAGAGTAGAGAAGAGATGGIASLFMGLLFVVLVPALIIVVAVIATLCIRIGLIYLLVVLAPVAFACYCLPNTEQYFQRWWKLLQETLLIYPIITIMFALSIILSQSTQWATSSADGKSGAVLVGVGFLVSLIMLILPLVGIPFAFKLAGGLLGRIHDFAATNGKRGITDGVFKGRREAAAAKAKTALNQGRVNQFRKYENSGFVGRKLARGIRGYEDMREIEAHANAEGLKRAQAINDTGDDQTLRALTVNKKWADRNGVEGTDWRTASDGTKEYRTAAGAWVTGAQVDDAYQQYGNNNAVKQWALGHEMEKAATQEENDYLSNSTGRLLGKEGSWGVSETQAKGILKGAAFSKQNVDRQWKHYGLDYESGQMKMGTGNALTMMREIDEKQGNYAMMQQNAETWTTMSQAMEDSRSFLNTGAVARDDTQANGGEAYVKNQQQRREAEEVLERGARIAHATRSASMSPTGQVDGDGNPMPTVVGGGGDRVGAGAAGRVQEEMGRFVGMADQTAGRYTPPTSSPAAPERAPAGPRDNLDRRESPRPGATPTNPSGVPNGGSSARADKRP